jgi:carbamoyltransferase
MAILGISDSHDASAALLLPDGTLRALQEERPRRVKNFSGLPEQAIAWLLAEAGLRPRDVTEVAIANLDPFTPTDRAARLRGFAENATLAGRLRIAARETPMGTWVMNRRRAARVRSLESLGFAPEQLRNYDHHLCHAATAYFGDAPGADPVLVVTCDGAGDGLCATVSIGRDGVLERRFSVPWANSFGLVYAVVTYMSGMVPNEHEYKLMGMAPYASPPLAERVRDKLLDLFVWDASGAPVWARKPGMPHMLNIQPVLEKLFRLERFDAIMGGVQLFAEAMLCEFIRRAIATTGIRRVAASGGVFMNVKANKAILEMPEVERLFIFPSCGDETNSIGAAYLARAARDGAASVPAIASLYLGPEWSEAEIHAALEPFAAQGAITVERPESINAAVLDCLMAGEVVARFAGREEFGARSLGNRAILADPRNPGIIQVINDLVKSRDFWMPFAASILEECADEYLLNPKRIAAPYMILSFDTTPLGAAQIRAGIHPYDRTCRPQVVSRTANPDYWDLIEGFRQRSGLGALLNTSLNLHGLPLVHRPVDALEVLMKSGLTRLAIGPYLVTRREDGSRSAEEIRRHLASAL